MTMTSSASSRVRHLSIDIETYSPADLKSVGVYRYAEDPGFRILLFAYAWDDGPVQVADLVHGEIPDYAFDALDDPTVVKHAFNAQFERVCLSRWLGMRDGYLDPAQWRCTMVQAAYWGVQGSLKQVSAFLGVAAKEAAGTRLINRFSRPGRGGATPDFEGEDWDLFVSYNRQDVVVEREVQRALPGPIPDGEQRLYATDQRINDRGVLVDTVLADSAERMAEAGSESAKERLGELTGLDNPNSTVQLRGWLAEHGHPMDSIGREALEALLASGPDPLVAEVVELRLETARSSIKKYTSAAGATCEDGRLRGCFRFYGAATGRWAGRLMQLQNLPRGDLHGDEVDAAREYVRAGDTEAVELLWGDVPGVLKSLVRTVLIPKPGCVFAVSDFSAIEARVLAWLAGEAWVLREFSGEGKIYEATASRMFGVPVDAVDKELRQKGKVATLALGYQGGPAALERMGALKMGIPEQELPKMVRMWRNANRAIVGFWGLMDAAARLAILGEGPTRTTCGRGQVQVKRNGWVDGMSIELPSGRSLVYRSARLEDGKMSYVACGRGAGVVLVDTYGGRLVENVTQAVARDLLASAMRRLEGEGFDIVAHVHDEVVVEVPRCGAQDTLERINELMSEAPVWARGLPLRADGYLCDSYRKG